MVLQLHQQPTEGGLGLGLGAGREEGLNRVARIAQPGVAVVPVLVAAQTLGQGGGGGRGDGARRGIEQQLQRQGAADEVVAIQAGAVQSRRPVPPLLIRQIYAGVDLFDGGNDQRLVPSGDDGHRATLARADDDRSDNALVGPVARDAWIMHEQTKHPLDMEDRVFADLGVIGIGRIAPPPQTHVQSERHLTFQAVDAPGQFAPRQPPGRAAVEAFGQAGAAGGRGEFRFQHIAVRPIAAGRREGLGGCDGKPPAVRIEQAVEQGRGVDRRHAPPIDAAVQG